jgi:hypothetical protein
MKVFKCVLIDSYNETLVATILIKAESSDDEFLKVNENYCLNSDFVIDSVEEIPLEDVKI